MEKKSIIVKYNILITAIIIAIVIGIGVYTGIQFKSFRDYEAEFVIREDVVDEVIKFHEYSKNLEGTIGDSEIYVINGTENSVALIRKDNIVSLASLDSLKTARVAGVKNSVQLEAAKMNLENITELDSVAEAKNALLNNKTDAVILSHGEAKKIAKENDNLIISKAVVEKVPSILVIGGTHPNEPSGQLTATLLLENVTVKRGIMYIITELNKSAYSFSQPQEATTWFYNLTTANGTNRQFKYGSRATNTVDQWPTPDVYTHSSGQQLSSSEVRNINRAYPGSETGTYTEQIAYAITNFVTSNDVTIVADLHEASPEYLTINACVYHEDSEMFNVAMKPFFRYADGKRMTIKNDPSDPKMHGLTHRELGDYTNAYVLLFETSNASQGKLRGAFTEDLITYYKKDKFYEGAVQYDKENGTSIIVGAPVSIDERVARHTLSIQAAIKAFNVKKTTRVVNVTQRDNVGVGGEMIGDFIVENIPSYLDVLNNGVGYHLLDSKR